MLCARFLSIFIHLLRFSSRFPLSAHVRVQKLLVSAHLGVHLPVPQCPHSRWAVVKSVEVWGWPRLIPFHFCRYGFGKRSVLQDLSSVPLRSLVSGFASTSTLPVLSGFRVDGARFSRVQTNAPVRSKSILQKYRLCCFKQWCASSRGFCSVSIAEARSCRKIGGARNSFFRCVVHADARLLRVQLLSSTGIIHFVLLCVAITASCAVLCYSCFVALL